MGVAHYDVNLYDASVVADPFPIYEEIRARGRVVRNDAMNLWMVPGFDDCMKAYNNTDDFNQLLSPEVTPWFQGNNMLMVDGDHHARLRKVLAPAFTRQATATWERRVHEAVDEIVDPAIAKGSFDIIGDFTMIPIVVVAEMMGVPRERHGDFQRWSHAIVDNLAYGLEGPGVMERLLATGDEANGYLAEEIDRHRREQPDDLITMMLQSDMSESEISSTALLLVLAGYDTTAKLLSNTLVVLDRHRDQRAALAADHSLIPQGIEEVLRWTGVVHIDPRIIVRDVEFAGSQLKAGEILYILVGAAGRDATRWPDPHRFDVRREQRSNLAFGFGSHLCLGMPLARLEVKAALERLLTLAPNYSTRDVDYGNSLNVRGPERGVVDVNL